MVCCPVQCVIGGASHRSQCDLPCADPLIMDNGLDLIDMMCSCYESPEDTVEEAVQYNFSQSNNPCVHPSACPSSPCKVRALCIQLASLSIPAAPS